MSVKEVIQASLQSQKAGAIASALTAGTGIGTIFDYIPSDIGKLASVFGIGLSIVLIRLHMVNIEKGKVELEIKRNELRAQRNKLYDDSL